MNQGVINGNTAGGTLGVYMATANSGTLEATNGGLLAIQSNVANNGGAILASGGTVVVQANVTGGTISGTGFWNFRSGTLSGVTVGANSIVTVLSSGSIYVANGMTNNGMVAMPSGVLYFNGQQTLLGSGTIAMGPQVTFQIQSGTLTQAAGHAITGAGRFFAELGGYFVNQSLVNANVAGQTLALPVSITNSGSMDATSGGSLMVQNGISNAGTVLASGGTVNIIGAVAQLSGGTLTGGTWIARGGSPLLMTTGSSISTNQATVILDGAGSSFANMNAINGNQGSFSLLDGQTFSTTGSLANSGTIDVDAASNLAINGSYSSLPGSHTIVDGKLVYTGTMSVFGSLGGSGTVGGSVSVAAGGTLAPGDAPGTLTVAGNLSLANSSVYDFEIGSTAADLTLVTGNLTFGANEILDVMPYGSSLPPPGDYPLFTVDGAIASLPSWTINLPAGWTSGGIVEAGNQVILTDLQPVPEPSTVVLLVACAGGLAVCAWPRSKRRKKGRRTACELAP